MNTKILLFSLLSLVLFNPNCIAITEIEGEIFDGHIGPLDFRDVFPCKRYHYTERHNTNDKCWCRD